MKKLIKFLIVIFVIVIALGALSVALRHVPVITYVVQETNSQSHWGTISGSLSYPSESLPALGVCAKSVTGEEMFCTYQMIPDQQYKYGYGYEIDVPPDTYNVFAHLVDDANALSGYTDEERAYYSEFVTCGLLFDCPSHAPIQVTVGRNAHLQDIDPADWYNFL